MIVTTNILNACDLKTRGRPCTMKIRQLGETPASLTLWINIQTYVSGEWSWANRGGVGSKYNYTISTSSTKDANLLNYP